jgi:hypothetical protein
MAGRRPETGEEGGRMSDPDYEFFVGVDWGSETHVVCVLDRDRRRLAERAYPHSGAG